MSAAVLALLRAQVYFDLPGSDRRLLGDVVGVEADAAGAARLRVRHFNGEPWPVSPLVDEVVVLAR